MNLKVSTLEAWSSGTSLSHPQPSPRQMEGRETILGFFTCFFRHWWAQVLILNQNIIYKDTKENYHRSAVYSVNTYSLESHLHIHIQKLYIYIYIIRAQNLQMMDPYKCAGSAVCGRLQASSSVPTLIKTRSKLNA